MVRRPAFRGAGAAGKDSTSSRAFRPSRSGRRDAARTREVQASKKPEAGDLRGLSASGRGPHVLVFPYPPAA